MKSIKCPKKSNQSVSLKATFQSKSKALITSITRQFAAVRKADRAMVEAKYALIETTSVLGTSLLKLRGMCKEYKQAWRTVVTTQVGINLRTANRYISNINEAKGLPAGVVSAVHAAGFNPTQTRILKKIKALGNAKVEKLTNLQLAETLTKKRGQVKKVNPSTQLREAIIRSFKTYINRLSDEETTPAELAAIEVKAAKLIAAIVSNESETGIHIITKAA